MHIFLLGSSNGAINIQLWSDPTCGRDEFYAQLFLMLSQFWLIDLIIVKNYKWYH